MKTPLRRIKDASFIRPDPDVMESVMEHWLALAIFTGQEGNANLCYPSWTFRLNYRLEGWQPHEYGKRFQLNFTWLRHHSLTFVATVAGLKDINHLSTVWAFTGEVRKDGDKLRTRKPVDLKTRAIIRAFSEWPNIVNDAELAVYKQRTIRALDAER
ncbi:hypothetical protein SPFM20_00171 [Salmonella phage SPFM20]|nr:hypothetical protein SPFM20_00171 [Salmonella phage SPFM20]